MEDPDSELSAAQGSCRQATAKLTGDKVEDVSLTPLFNPTEYPGIHRRWQSRPPSLPRYSAATRRVD